MFAFAYTCVRESASARFILHFEGWIVAFAAFLFSFLNHRFSWICIYEAINNDTHIHVSSQWIVTCTYSHLRKKETVKIATSIRYEWCRERSSYLVPVRTAAFQNTLIGIKYWISSPHLIHFTLIFDVNMFFSAAIQALMHLRFDECSSRTKIIEKKTAYSFSRAEAIKSPDVFKSFFFLLFVFRFVFIRVDKLK